MRLAVNVLLRIVFCDLQRVKKKKDTPKCAPGWLDARRMPNLKWVQKVGRCYVGARKVALSRSVCLFRPFLGTDSLRRSKS